MRSPSPRRSWPPSSSSSAFADWPPADIDWFTGIAVVDFGWLLPVWVASLAFSDAYSRRQFARGSDEFKALLKGSASAAAVVAMAAYLVNYDMSRGFFALTFGLGTGGLVLERYAVRRHVARLRSRDALMHRVVAVGDRFAVEELHQALRRQPTLGYQLVGACSTADAVLWTATFRCSAAWPTRSTSAARSVPTPC